MSTPTPGPADGSSDYEQTEAIPPPPSEPTQPTQTMPSVQQWQSDPGPGQPVPAQGPNTFVAALSDQVAVLTRLTKGQTLEALRIASQSRMLWVVALVAGALITALVLSISLGRLSGVAMSTVSTIFGGSSVYFGMTVGAWFTVFLMTVILVGIVMGLRVVALHLTYRMAGSPQSFRSSMSLTAAAYSIHLPIMVVVLVLMLIPGRSWAMIVAGIGAYLWLLCGLLSELLIYIGLNRTTAFKGSPLRMHAIATAIWMAAVGIIYLLTSMIMSDISMSALGGLL